MSRRFDKIVCVDDTRLQTWAIEKLQEVSSSEIEVYKDYPQEENEIIRRIGAADCVFVSWKTRISANVIRSCENLKYIGMCCSLIDKNSANVAIQEAKNRNIAVYGVKDYGDEGVVEFIFSQLISLAKGLHGLQWRDFPTELNGKKLGIVGLGTLGFMVSKVALAFGMKVYYYSRTRKKDLENSNLQYLPLNQLLSTIDILSTHLPRYTEVLGEEEFALLKPNTVLVNTSIGPTFNIAAFEKWISNPGNFAVIDDDAATGYKSLYKKYKNVLYSEKAAGLSNEMYKRLSQKVVNNALNWLKEPS